MASIRCYFLMREVPFGNDGDFSHRAMGAPDERRSRQRFRQLGAGVTLDDQQELRGDPCRNQAVQDQDTKLRSVYDLLPNIKVAAVPGAILPQGAGAIWLVIDDANRYVDDQAPWT